MRSLLPAGLFLLQLSAACGSDCCDAFGRADDPEATCSSEEAIRFVYDTLRDTYLYADQVPELDLSEFTSPEELLSRVRAMVEPQDQFSFMVSRVRSDDSRNGVISGSFGLRLVWVEGEGFLVSRVLGTFEREPPTPASEAGIGRGDLIVAVDGQALTGLDRSEAGALLGPGELGVTRTLDLIRPSGDLHSVTLEKGRFNEYTVPVVRTFEDGIGYVLFERFLSRSIAELDQAFAELRSLDLRALILDFRWNRGGVSTASQHLLGLVLGAQAEGLTAYSLQYNRRYSDCSPKFYYESKQQSLPGIEEVVIITGPGTASASELVWNTLRAYVPVRVVGVDTTGKPYGSYSYQFCGRVLNPINYRRENAEGQSVPIDGIQPDCEAFDLVTGELGNPSDNLLMEALSVIRTGQCSGMTDVPQREFSSPPMERYLSY